jgi:hypothetical protein
MDMEMGRELATRLDTLMEQAHAQMTLHKSRKALAAAAVVVVRVAPC